MPLPTNYNPDVLTCLANLSNDEVFTPPSIVNQILDMLPAEIWRDKTVTFLDPCSKSGVFLREIAKRLIAGLASEIPDLQTRVNHIFEKQIFGLAITELTALLSRRSLYCSKKADGKYSVYSNAAAGDGNIRFTASKHIWRGNRCVYCGASQGNFDRPDGLESHAYEFIHTEKPHEIFNMKFDVIIGNPPYQLDTGGSGRQATPLYDKFVLQAKKLNPRYLSMIIPSRWFAGGMGLEEFRQEMLNDQRMKKIVDFIDARDCFPGVDIAGGVCYFLWDQQHNGKAEISNILMGKTYTSDRNLNEFETFVRFSPAVPILQKVQKKNLDSIVAIVSATVPFGLKTSERGANKGDLTLISSKGVSKISTQKITAGNDMIDRWKVITSKASHDHAGQPDREGKRRILSRLEVHPPKTIITGSYIILGCFDTEEEAKNLQSYASTHFFRFLVSLLSFSQDITRERFRFVPMMDFTKSWTDENLYKFFGINDEEITTIESMIKPMEITDGR